MTTKQKCPKCNGIGHSKSYVLGWGIATVPLTCINCMGSGYTCIPVKPKEPIRK